MIASEVKDSRSVVIFKTRILELYIDQKFFSQLLSFCISLACKCILIAVFIFFKQVFFNLVVFLTVSVF